jgi:hypothetical protein
MILDRALEKFKRSFAIKVAKFRRRFPRLGGDLGTNSPLEQQVERYRYL